MMSTRHVVMAVQQTRPLGATVGDLLTKPHEAGGMDLSRITSSAMIAVVIIALILIVPQKAGSHSGEKAT